jgi:hypothetical protein
LGDPNAFGIVSALNNSFDENVGLNMQTSTLAITNVGDRP